jgi:small subunit ribosomal protein S17
MPRKKKDELEGEQTSEATETAEESTSIIGSVLDAAASTLVSVAETVGTAAATVVSAVTSPDAPSTGAVHKRAEKIGIVASDKMTNTVTVRVDRLVKHPVYRKYVKKRKKFMAHDELGSKIGDKVKIVETRPLSARKRWRVVEILKKAEL